MISQLTTILDLEKEAFVSSFLQNDVLFCYRAKRRACLLSNYLLTEQGRLHRLEETLSLLEEEGCMIRERGYNDEDIHQHFVVVLRNLKKHPSLVHKLQSFALPVCDVAIEELIAVTLDVEEKITNRHLVWAVFSALLCPLRQNVGSCFATAPAILIQEEQMEQFLLDFVHLLTKGKLERVHNGIDYIVPISPSPGLGDLKKPYYAEHPGFAKILQVYRFSVNDVKGLSFLDVLQAHFLKHYHLEKKDIDSRSESTTHLSLAKVELIKDMQRSLQRAKWTFVAFSQHLLLKVWEYSLASFSDVKTEFSSWNLFASLGLNQEEKGGIGQLIYTALQGKLERVNERLSEVQQDYEIAFDQVRATEVLLRNVSSYEDARRLKAEHQARLYHLHACEDICNKTASYGQNVAKFFTFLIENIMGKFKEYFQEVYDPEMEEPNKATIYDDSLAGFRLLFKHGRKHVKSWSFLYTKEDYIQALKEFFLLIEHALIEQCAWEKGKEEVPLLITAIVFHIQTEEFFISALERMTKLNHPSYLPIGGKPKKPWAYISGGTVYTLLKTYFRKEHFSEEARWVESPQDLLIFYLETLKALPPSITNSFFKKKEKRLLASSPTHVFSLLPGKELFRKGWEDSGFTYTFVRDQIILPRKAFYKKILLSKEAQRFLLEELRPRLPSEQAHLLSHEIVVEELSLEAFGKKLSHFSFLPSFLLEMVPLVTAQEAKQIFMHFHLKEISFPPLMGRRPFFDFLLSFFPKFSSSNFYEKIASFLEKAGFFPPSPCVFADTNWAKLYFSFLINPVNLELELWRTDQLGLTGEPMLEWQLFLNGEIRENWGVFFNPFEYTSTSF